MAKTLVVGDVHLKAGEITPRIDGLLDSDSDITRVAFVGDICDDWGAYDDEMVRDLENFIEWVEDRRADGYQVDIVFGNHDFQYKLGEEGPGTHVNLFGFVNSELFSLNFRIACEVDGFLVTHAGLTQSFADEYLDDPQDAKGAAEQLNEMLDTFDYDTWQILASCGVARGGEDIPGPLWADKWELEEDFVEGIPQIVGHTPVASACKAYLPGVGDDAPEIWFCDTMSSMSDGTPMGDSSMLLVEDGKVGKVNP